MRRGGMLSNANAAINGSYRPARRCTPRATIDAASAGRSTNDECVDMRSADPPPNAVATDRALAFVT
ncbi:hypothetical protein SAMN02745121_01148 [Nannocystis exedens]|uniref:Uncharacterized protein n=2 Tax=Nannocystis exedens TaxID=54 RepID=A0A1I1UCZ3_9BACT|nr:hypothetical protein NAEX_04681 [Nannocystis exedens]SFD68554.1 hypothetical protein SAMN02745121_01148 [Nannocystis exedens]